MPEIPTLKTERLLLRSFQMADKLEVQELASVKEIAATTLSIPHPYSLEDAEHWLQTKIDNFENDKEIAWAICNRNTESLLGAIGLGLDLDNEAAELGFWIGKPFWGKGYVTEAARKILEYAFSDMNLNRVEANHMVGNDASGRVLEKLGMQYEGMHRQLIKKWGEFKDVKRFAILKSDSP